ncbi:MAG: hypothetical protein ACRDWY_15840, partial [Actinomycetes bacterium]
QGGTGRAHPAPATVLVQRLASGPAVGAAVSATIGTAVGATVRTAVGAAVRTTVRTARATIGAAVTAGATIGAAVRTTISTAISTAVAGTRLVRSRGHVVIEHEDPPSAERMSPAVAGLVDVLPGRPWGNLAPPGLSSASGPVSRPRGS